MTYDPGVRSISPSLFGRNFKFGVWMHLRTRECRISFLGHCDLDLLPRFQKNSVWSISPSLFEVGIPILVGICTLGWQSVAFHFWVSVTLT